jgi:hypothetical protein
MEGWFLFGIEPWKGVAHSADNNNSQMDYLGRSWLLFMDSVTTVNSNPEFKVENMLDKRFIDSQFCQAMPTTSYSQPSHPPVSRFAHLTNGKHEQSPGLYLSPLIPIPPFHQL